MSKPTIGQTRSAISKYVPVVVGWSGLAVAATWLFGIIHIPAWFLVETVALTSAVLLIYGQHDILRGRYDD